MGEKTPAAPDKKQAPQYTPRFIQADELHRRLEAEENLLLVDVMPPSQYLLVHLPGAINIPLEYLHDIIEYLPHDRDIVLYCTNEECEFSNIAAHKLDLHGFANALVLQGGMEAWEDAGHHFATILLEPEEEPHEHTLAHPATEKQPTT